MIYWDRQAAVDIISEKSYALWHIVASVIQPETCIWPQFYMTTTEESYASGGKIEEEQLEEQTTNIDNIDNSVGWVWAVCVNCPSYLTKLHLGF